MILSDFFKKIFRSTQNTINELDASITKEYKDTKQTYKDVLFKGKWSASDMQFVQLWNNAQYEPEKRNYSRRMLIYRTPDYMSIGDENGGTDNGRDESISLTVNIEEGKVFLENYNQAAKIFKNKEDVEVFIQEAQKKFDNDLDMGKGTNFIFGWGGCMASLMEYENPNIEYIPLIFPDNEKFRISSYRNKVEWSLIEKGAIMITPQKGKAYLAVIQRKNKPRDLKPFLKYIVQRPICR